MRKRQDIDVIGESPYQPRVGHVINLEWVHRYRAWDTHRSYRQTVTSAPLVTSGYQDWRQILRHEHSTWRQMWQNSNHHKSPARECIICMLSHLGQRWAGVVYLETGNIRSDKKRQIPSDQQKWNAIVTALQHTLSFFLKMLNSKSGLKNQCHGMSIEPTTIPRHPCSLCESNILQLFLLLLLNSCACRLAVNNNTNLLFPAEAMNP